MNADTFTTVTAELHAEAARIATSKRPGYTGGADDVLANFKNVANRTGLTAEQAWCVYFLKHVDAIVSIMSKPDLPVSEAPIGRFSDALNYLDLGWALLAERQSDPFAAPERTATEVTADAQGPVPIASWFYVCNAQCGMYRCTRRFGHTGWHQSDGGFSW